MYIPVQRTLFYCTYVLVITSDTRVCETELGSMVDNNDKTGADGQPSLSACATTLQTVTIKHRWQIHEFSIQRSLCSVGETIKSTEFGTQDGKYRFRLILFPRGKDEAHQSTVTLHLRVEKCPLSKLRLRVNGYMETAQGPHYEQLEYGVISVHKGDIASWPSLIAYDIIRNQPSTYTPGNVLTVCAELTLYVGQVCKEVDTQQIAPGMLGSHNKKARYRWSGFF